MCALSLQMLLLSTGGLFAPAVAHAEEPAVVESASPGAPAEHEAAWQSPGWGAGGLPAFNYDTDRGFGFGAAGELYRYDGQTSPYTVRVSLLFFMTTLAIHDHALGLDVVELADGRLRLTGRAGLRVSRTDHFCGLGGDVTCDPTDATAAADERGLGAEARDLFIERYHRTRLTLPYLDTWARYKLVPDRKNELVMGYRLAIHRDGDLTDGGPFPGSAYDELARSQRTEGVYSQLSAGVMFDTRDFELAPSRGLWTEFTLRGASRFWGSSFDALGANATLRGYAPLHDRRLVLASRVVADGLTGTIPPLELAFLGGTDSLSGYGGSTIGRGIRSRRYRGRVTLVAQSELRWWFLRFHIGSLPIDLTAAAFVDAGHVAATWADIGRSPLRVGEGGGLRIAFADSFILRMDAAVSRAEGYDPYLYLRVGHPY